MSAYSLANVTTTQFAALARGPRPFVVLLPVGSVEPHGPHLGLLTDSLISEASAEWAAVELERRGLAVRIAPTLPYGVTDFAAGFEGAVSVPGKVLSDFLEAVVRGFLDGGARHVCVVNNHLEPAQYQALLAAAGRFEADRCSVACPLARRWARTLSEEFRRGECHAGRYETSLMLAAAPRTVRDDLRASLPEVKVSLSEGIKAGAGRFTEMGMHDAYAGAPAQASREEGEQQLARLATMISTGVLEALRFPPEAHAGGPPPAGR